GLREHRRGRGLRDGTRVRRRGDAGADGPAVRRPRLRLPRPGRQHGALLPVQALIPTKSGPAFAEAAHGSQKPFVGAVVDAETVVGPASIPKIEVRAPSQAGTTGPWLTIPAAVGQFVLCWLTR